MPLWTAGWSLNNNWSGRNYGHVGVNVVKVSLSDSVDALGTYVGFVVPKGTPFISSTGGNEVDIASSGNYHCWMYGNYMPNNAQASNYAATYKTSNYPGQIWPAKWVGTLALRTQNFMVCEIRREYQATLNQIIIPFKQYG